LKYLPYGFAQLECLQNWNYFNFERSLSFSLAVSLILFCLILFFMCNRCGDLSEKALQPDTPRAPKKEQTLFAVKCSLIALTNSTAPPNDIKQALHISSLPLPLALPFACGCVATDGMHNGLFPAGTEDQSLLQWRKKQFPPCSLQPYTCLRPDMAPKSLELKNWDGVVNLQPEQGCFFPRPVDGLILQCCPFAAHWPRYFLPASDCIGFNNGLEF